MAASTGWALQKGIYQALAGSSELGGLLGGARIYDDPPQSARYPFITLGESLVRDWSTGTDAGEEHTVSLHIWSAAAGRREHERRLAAGDRRPGGGLGRRRCVERRREPGTGRIVEEAERIAHRSILPAARRPGTGPPRRVHSSGQGSRQRGQGVRSCD